MSLGIYCCRCLLIVLYWGTNLLKNGRDNEDIRLLISSANWKSKCWFGKRVQECFLFAEKNIVGFLWKKAYLDPHCDDRQVIVQLFEWSWDAVARECEDVLGPKGFCGVQARRQVSHQIINNYFFSPKRSPLPPTTWRLWLTSGGSDTSPSRTSSSRGAGRGTSWRTWSGGARPQGSTSTQT